MLVLYYYYRVCTYYYFVFDCFKIISTFKFLYSYNYDWKLEEAKKNLLRTHTTAVSARMLYALANQVLQLIYEFGIQNSIVYSCNL